MPTASAASNAMSTCSKLTWALFVGVDVGEAWDKDAAAASDTGAAAEVGLLRASPSWSSFRSLVAGGLVRAEEPKLEMARPNAGMPKNPREVRCDGEDELDMGPGRCAALLSLPLMSWLEEAWCPPPWLMKC